MLVDRASRAASRGRPKASRGRHVEVTNRRGGITQWSQTSRGPSGGEKTAKKAAGKKAADQGDALRRRRRLARRFGPTGGALASAPASRSAALRSSVSRSGRN